MSALHDAQDASTMRCPCRASLRPGREPAASGNAQNRIESLQCEPSEETEQHRFDVNHSVSMSDCNTDCNKNVACLNQSSHVQINRIFVVVDTDALSSSRQLDLPYHLLDPLFNELV